MNNLYVGVDPSLRGTGVCCIQDDAVFAFRIESDAKTLPANSLPERFAVYDHNARQLMSRMRGFSTLSGIAVFESSYESRHANAVQLIENAAMMKERCLAYVQVYELPPASLRKFIGVGHKDDRSMIPVRVAARWKVEFPSHDEYVAYALARVAKCIRERNFENQQQQEVVEKMLAVKVPKKRKKSA